MRERFGNGGNRFRRSGQLREIPEMPVRQRDDHERSAVATGEVLAVLAVDGVAQPRPLRAVDHHLGEEPEIGSGTGNWLR